MKSCPQCHLLLESGEVDGIPYLACRGCGGYWLTGDALVRALESGNDAIQELDSHYPAVAASDVYEGLNKPCPECRTSSLERAPIPGSPEATAPACSRCGGFFLLPSDRAALKRASVEPDPSTESDQEIPATERDTADPAAIAESAPQYCGAVETVTTQEEPPSTVEDQSDSELTLDRLMRGNRRFAAGRPERPNQSRERVREVALSQHPAALVIGCVDSRAAPEIIFDQGLGDLLVIRTPAQILSDLNMDMVEYAVSALGIPLVVVLGHSRCVAVNEAVDDSPDHPALVDLVKALEPAIEVARRLPGGLLDNAVRSNVQMVVRRLKRFMSEWVESGRVRIAGAYYDLDTGIVDLLAEEPDSPGPAAPGREQGLETTQSIDIEATTSGAALESQGVPVSLVDGTPRALSRWCPQCRRGYPESLTFCTRCGIGLAVASFRAPCLKCHADNAIGDLRCRSCGAALHPDAEEHTQS